MLMLYIHTTDSELIQKLLDKGIKPVSIVADRYSFIYTEESVKICADFDIEDYVVNNCVPF